MKARLIAVTLLAFGLAACAMTPGPDPHRYGELVPGASTQADAIAKLGPPNSTSQIGQGRSLLQWINPYALSPIHVAIAFGSDGRMIGVQHVFAQ